MRYAIARKRSQWATVVSLMLATGLCGWVCCAVVEGGQGALSILVLYCNSFTF